VVCATVAVLSDTATDSRFFGIRRAIPEKELRSVVAQDAPRPAGGDRTVPRGLRCVLNGAHISPGNRTRRNGSDVRDDARPAPMRLARQSQISAGTRFDRVEVTSAPVHREGEPALAITARTKAFLATSRRVAS
jgi:hypothetical protein